jgi:hypothetical protein
MFPITRKQLQSFEFEASVPKRIIQDIVVHRIANEIFANASEGKKHYSCDIATADASAFLKRLFAMFPDCKIELAETPSPSWLSLSVTW